MTKTAPPACDHIGLLTSRAERLVDFYTRRLGFTVTRDTSLTASLVRTIFGIASPCRFVTLEAPGGSFHIELFEPHAGAARRLNRAAGINHFGFIVPDRAAAAARLRAGGAPVIEVPRGDRVIYFVKDPDGNRIELRDQPAGHPRRG